MKNKVWIVWLVLCLSTSTVVAQQVIAFQGGENTPQDNWSFTASGANSEAIAQALTPANKKSGTTSLVVGGTDPTGGSCFAGGTGNGAVINNIFTFESLDLSVWEGLPKTLQFWYGNRQPNCNGPGWDTNEDLIFQAIIDGVPQAAQTLVTGGGDISLNINNTSFSYDLPECAQTFGFILRINLNRRDEILLLDDVSLTVFGTPVSTELNAGNGGSICPGGTLQLNGSVEGPLTNVIWSGGAGTFGNSNDPETDYTASANESGTVLLTLSATTACGNVLEDQISVIVDGTAPNPSIISSEGLSICPGQESTLTAFGGQDYLWSTGEIGEDIFVNMPGTYSVDVSNNCGTSTASITLAANPAIPATAQLSLCAGGTVVLPGGTTVGAAGVYETTVSSGGNGCDTLYTTTVIEEEITATAQLSLCAGGTVVLPGGTTVSVAGIYETTVSAGGNGCDTLYTTTVVEEEITATAQLSLCAGGTVVLPGGTTVSVAGIYETTVSAGGNGCDTLYTTTVVEEEISISQQFNICTGSSVLLPDGSSVDSAGIYETIILAGGNGCDTLFITTVAINEPLTASEEISTCNFDAGTYTVMTELFGGEPGTYEANGIGGTFAGNVFTSNPIPAGTAYNFSISDANGCETVSFSGAEECICFASAELSGDAEICAGQVANLLIALEGTAPFAVSYSDGIQTFDITSEEFSMSLPVSPTTETSYSLISMSDALCSGAISGSALIDVLALPNAGSDGTLTICNSDEAVNLNASLQGNPDPNGIWSFAGSELPNGTFVPAFDEAGTYRYTIEGGICGAVSAEVEVQVLATPQAQLSGMYERCPDEELILPFSVSGDGPFSVLMALNGNALPRFSVSGSNPTFAANAAGTYSILEISSAQCTGTASGSIEVNNLVTPISVIEWESAGEESGAEVLVFSSPYSGAPITYAWQFYELSAAGALLRSIGESAELAPRFSPPGGNGGTFRACLALTASNGCSNRTCKDLNIPVRRYFYMPNAFTPNGDGSNDLFFPVMEGYDDFDFHWRIFDRIGHLVFESTDQKDFWNGSKLGSSHYVQAGTYVWSISLKSRTGAESEVRRGHVTIVR